MEIKPGDAVEVINARGERSTRIAMTGVIPGRDFPVVRVAYQQEYQEALDEGREPESVAWPAEDVRPMAATS